MFEKQLGRNLREIQRLLQEDRYEPDPVLRHYIEKDNGKLCPLGVPTIRERVTQQAVRQIIEPIFEQDFYAYSFGFRKGYSAHQALTTNRRAKRAGYEYAVDLDIRSFFDEIPHDLLMEKVHERITDGRVLKLIRDWLTAGVMEDDQFHETEVGSPQGSHMTSCFYFLRRTARFCLSFISGFQKSRNGGQAHTGSHYTLV